MKVAKIYYLQDADENIRYIGCTTRALQDRLNDHKWKSKSAKNQKELYDWILKNDISIHLICETDAPEKDETVYIEKYKSYGHDLLNVSAGGSGMKGHKFSAEHRAKLSESNRRRAGKVGQVIHQRDKSGKLIQVHRSAANAERLTGIPATSISKCIKGDYKTAGGFKWERA